MVFFIELIIYDGGFDVLVLLFGLMDEYGFIFFIEVMVNDGYNF